MFKQAKRMEYFHTSLFNELVNWKHDYEKNHTTSVIDFSVGSPNVPVDESIVNVLHDRVMEPKNYKYALEDLPEMKEAIQYWYKNRYQVDLELDQMVCLQGSQEALSTMFLAFCDPEDVVLVPDPHYPIFAQAPHLAHANVEFMPLLEENDYLIDFDAIDPEIAKKAKMMIVSYPNNPTCAIANDAFYEKLVKFAKENDILVVHDNAYSELVFDGNVGKSFLAYPGAMEVGIELNSFSKTYGMAGARLGVMVGNAQAISIYKALKSNMDYGIFLPIQYAGIQALRFGGKSIESTRMAYQNRRDLLIKAFNEAGWFIKKSPATMFVWAKIPDGFEDSLAFAKDLFEKTGVLVSPGLGFGSQGKDYVRFALVVEDEQIQEAAQRIKTYFDSLK